MKRPCVLLRRLFGPEQANLSLLGSPHRTIDCAQGLNLVVIVCPISACQGGRRFIWKELRSATHREGDHLTDPRGLWQKGRRRGRNPNSGCWHGRKELRPIRAATVARPQGDDSICSLPPNLHSRLL